MNVSIAQTIKDIDNDDKQQVFVSKNSEKKCLKSPLTKEIFILPKEKS